MRAPQRPHLPRSASQLITGMFQYQGMRALQAGQWERGLTVDSPRGMRQTQTLRKLPKHAPSKAAQASSTGSGRAA